MILRITQNMLRNMQEKVPNILPLLRSETQRDLLEVLFSHQNGPQTLSDLARTIGVSQTTVMREVNRLLESGVVVDQRVGRSRTVRIDESSPLAGPLRQLLRAGREPEPGHELRDRHARFVGHGARHERRPLPSSMRRR